MHVERVCNSHQSSIVTHSLGKIFFKTWVPCQKTTLTMKWILIVCYYVTCSMTASLIEFFRVHQYLMKIGDCRGSEFHMWNFQFIWSRLTPLDLFSSFEYLDISFNQSLISTLGQQMSVENRLHFPKADKIEDTFSEAYHLIIAIVYNNVFRQKCIYLT